MADQFNFVSTNSKVRACMKNARNRALTVCGSTS